MWGSWMKYPDFGGEDNVKLGELKTRSIFFGETEFNMYTFYQSFGAGNG